jgi:hypothetical protein
VLDASTRVAAGTGSGVIDEHLHCAVDLADGLQVASTVLMLGLARKLILLRASRQSVTLNGNAELSVVEAANIGAGTHTQRYFSTRDDLKKQLTERRALAQRHAREGSLRERQQTRRQHRGLPQTMDAKERRTQWVEELKLQDRGRTHPTLRTYHLAKPTRKPTTLDHTKIAAAFTTFFAAMHIEPRAKAKAIKTLGKGNRVLLPPTAAKCDADIAPKTKSSIPPRTSQPARAQ